MTRVILWDSDGTLAFRPGQWGGCLLETLDEHEPGHGVRRQHLSACLQNGFPWHRPDVQNPELAHPSAPAASIPRIERS